jgi:uncharacterized cupin superfamily protein
MSDRVINLLEVELDHEPEPVPGHLFDGTSLTPRFGAKASGMAVYEIEPRSGFWPYHFHLSEEEFCFVIRGELTLRTPEGERVMRTGDVAWFPAGAPGAHTMRNHTDEIVRFAITCSDDPHGGGSVYPDSGKVSVWSDGFHHLGRLGEKTEYWEGEL